MFPYKTLRECGRTFFKIICTIGGIVALARLLGVYSPTPEWCRNRLVDTKTGASRCCADCFGGKDIRTHQCDYETCTATPIATHIVYDINNVRQEFYSDEEYETYYEKNRPDDQIECTTEACGGSFTVAIEIVDKQIDPKMKNETEITAKE